MHYEAHGDIATRMWTPSCPEFKRAIAQEANRRLTLR
jgi:hypothetical protein